MPIFMKIDGVKGQVQVTGFEEQISLDSAQWGVGRGIGTFTGTAREVSSPSVSEIVCSKQMDSSSMAILRNATFGDPLPEVVISFVRDKGQGEVEAYVTYTLSNVLVSSYSVSHSSGSEAPMESFALNFLIVKIDQTWRGGDYGAGGEDEFSFDLGKMAPA